MRLAGSPRLEISKRESCWGGAGRGKLAVSIVGLRSIKFEIYQNNINNAQVTSQRLTRHYNVDSEVST